MRTSKLISLIIVSGLSTGALAATEVIHQQGRAFSAENVTIKKGDPLTFLNEQHHVEQQGQRVQSRLPIAGQFD